MFKGASQLGRQSSFNYDLHAAALREMGFDLILTARPRSEWSLDKCRLDHLVVECRSEGGAAIVAGTSPSDSIIFAVLSAAATEGDLFNGQHIHALDLIVIPPAQKFIQTASGPRHWISAILPVADLARMEASIQEEISRLLEVRRALVLRSRTLARQVAVKATTIKSMMRHADASSGHFDIEQLEESLLTTLSAAALAALEREKYLPDHSRGRRASSYELAHRAVGLFHSAVPARQGVEDLCGALDATERRIRRSFHSFFGMGPTRLARLHRLNRVRQMLVAGIPENVKLMNVLSACDVTEFGRFAGEYKALFDEMPSETRRKHLVAGPRDAARAAQRQR